MKRLAWMLLWPALAAANEAELMACARTPDATARLACYDALAARLRGAPAPAAVPAVKAPAADANFGAQPKPGEQVEAVESHVPGVFQGWGPNTVFQLANGQRWRVIDGSSAVVYRKDPKVTVRRGALGSYWFEVQGLNSAAKVRRVD